MIYLRRGKLFEKFIKLWSSALTSKRKVIKNNFTFF